MDYICPACGKKLHSTYKVFGAIKVNDHPGAKCAQGGIGKVATAVQSVSKNQQKTKASTLGLADAKVKKQDKSVKNLNTYQTALKDSSKQQAREQVAKTVGLKGHGSSTSNSGQNNATKGGLAKINKG